jgi:hypothetical protein
MDFEGIINLLPDLYSVPGMILYSLLGYLFFIMLSLWVSPQEYTLEDYREQIRRNRETRVKPQYFTNN